MHLIDKVLGILAIIGIVLLSGWAGWLAYQPGTTEKVAPTAAAQSKPTITIPGMK
jgi:hypothetical protein